MSSLSTAEPSSVIAVAPAATAPVALSADVPGAVAAVAAVPLSADAPPALCADIPDASAVNEPSSPRSATNARAIASAALACEAAADVAGDVATKRRGRGPAAIPLEPVSTGSDRTPRDPREQHHRGWRRPEQCEFDYCCLGRA